MPVAALKPKAPGLSDSVHYLSENHSAQISKIASIDQIVAGSPLVQLTYSDSKGQTSLVEARLEKSDKGFYLTSSGYSENSRNWPPKDSQIVRLDKLEVAGMGEFAKVNLILNPQSLEQAFKQSTGTAIRVEIGYDYKDLFILSVNRDGIINAVELNSPGPLTDSYYKISAKGELLLCDQGEEYSSGKIKSISRSNSKMRLDLKSELTPNIEIHNEKGQSVGEIAPYELIQPGTPVNLTHSSGINKNESQSSGYWHGVQHGSAVVSDKNNQNVKLIPLDQINRIDNFGSSYSSKEDLAVYLAPKINKAGTPGAYTVYTGTIGSSQMPVTFGDYLFKVSK